MKKIVALVLALVLALSLATVAFGATNGAIQNQPQQTGKNWTLTKYGAAANGNDAADYDLAEADKVDVATHGDDTDDDGVVTKYATKVVITSADTTNKNGTYFEVGEAYATYKLSKGDVTYFLAKVNAADLDNGWLCTAKTATGTVSGVAADEAECGDYEVSGIVVKGTAYVKATKANGAYGDSNWAVLNGKFVPYGDTAVRKYAHTFTSYTTKNTAAGKAIPATVKCSECGNSFKVVEAADLNRDWVEEVNYVQLSGEWEYTRIYGGDWNYSGNISSDLNAVFGSGTYYAVLNETVGATNTSAAATTTTVDSSKTFDAGVAMYVGLSLMSVAGSAVVIGKKKEF